LMAVEDTKKGHRVSSIACGASELARAPPSDKRLPQQLLYARKANAPTHRLFKKRQGVPAGPEGRTVFLEVGEEVFAALVAPVLCSVPVPVMRHATNQRPEALSC